jgi:hypothetical protein
VRQTSDTKRARGLLNRARDATRRKGIGYVCRTGIKRILSRLARTATYRYYKSFKSSRTFSLQEQTYSYFYHEYNTTWKNERAVEIPVVWRIVNEYKRKKILEVGNVLSNYFSVNHDIVDKHERTRGVITQDIANFHPTKKYDLIVSISTLEHVGWDENPHDHMILHEPDKFLHVIRNLKDLLTPSGKIVITLPLGYNPALDKILRNRRVQFSRRFCLKRVSKDNSWIEVGWRDIENSQYGRPFPAANGLLIGVIEAWSPCSLSEGKKRL